MNLASNWPAWIQPALSLAGLLAIAAWVFKFLSHFTAKSKELRELDSEVNATLREALRDQKEAREEERAALHERVRLFDEQVQAAEKRLKNTAAEFRQADRMATVALFGIQLLATVLDGKPRERQQRATAELARALDAIRELARFAPPADVAQDRVRERFEHAANPVMTLFEAYLRADIGLEERTKLVRLLLTDARDHPEMPIRALFDRMLSNIDAAQAELGSSGRSQSELSAGVEAARQNLLGGA